MADERKPLTMSEDLERELRARIGMSGADWRGVRIPPEPFAELDATRAALSQAQGEVDRLTKERDEAQRLAGTMSGLRDAGERDYDALKLALAASQAEAAALREALRAAHDATEAAQEGTDIEGQGDESVMAAYEEGTRAVLRVTTPALSRAPGGREALRAIVTKAVDEGWDGGCSWMSAVGEFSSAQRREAIVARLVPDAGQKGAEG